MEKEKLTAAVAAMYWGNRVRFPFSPSCYKEGVIDKMGQTFLTIEADSGYMYNTPIDIAQLEVRKLDRVDALSEEQVVELVAMVMRNELDDFYDGSVIAVEDVMFAAVPDLEKEMTAFIIPFLLDGERVYIILNTAKSLSVCYQVDDEMRACNYVTDIINKLRGWGVDCDGLIERGIGYSPVKTESDGTGI